MKQMLNCLTATLLLLLFSSKVFSTDPYPYRGLYVDKFLTWNGGYPNIDLTKTILGQSSKEDSLLRYAHDNNYKYLALYNMEKIMDHINDPYPLDTSKTFAEKLCAFIVKAKTQYCVEHIGAVSGSAGYFDDIDDYNTLNISAAYLFQTGGNQFVPPSPNPLAFVETTYTAADGEIALRAEMVKTALRISDFNASSTCNGKIDVITTEYEFWQCKSGCPFPDSAKFDSSGVFHFHGGDYNTTGDSIRISNCEYFTLKIGGTHPTDTLFRWEVDGSDTDTIVAGSLGLEFKLDTTFYFCKPDDAFWSYRTLLNHMKLVKDSSTYIKIVDTYLGWFGQDTINDTLQTDIIDSVCNRIGLHAYRTTPSSLWSYISGRAGIFGHNHVPATIIHPIISSESTTLGAQANYLGPYLSNQAAGQTLFEAEKALADSAALHWSVNGDNDTIRDGSSIWFAQSFFKLKIVSSNRQYLDNKLFQRPSTTCSGSTVNFDYIGNHESGMTMVWDYADGTKDSLPNPTTAQQERTHIFNNAGAYIVSCTLYFPAPTDTGIAGCTPYTYRDTVTISGAAITGGPLAFCDGGSVTLTATAGGTGYQWKKDGNIISGATTNVYVAIATGIYPITVNGINGCNPSIASVTVTVYPKPEITATPTNVSCPSLCDGAVTTGVASGTTPFTYAWSPGGATTANISSVCINTYTVIVTDSLGCRDSATAIVDNPLNSCDMGTDYCGPRNASAIGTTFPSGTIGLHGNLTIDVNFFIRGNEVKIDSGVSIKILPGSILTISDTSWLHACHSMWQGIILTDSTSTLIIDSASTVEDADTAVNARFGGNVTIQRNDTIRRNLVGVSLRTAQSNLLVRGGIFDCPDTLNETTAAYISDTHILLFKADTVIIGDSTYHNKFINAKKGIDATYTWLTVYNADIFIDTSFIHSPDSASFGIKFTGDTIAAAINPYSLNVDRLSVPVIFKNYGYGIYSILRTSNYIKYCNFRNCAYGMRLETIRDQGEVYKNNFDVCKRIGIYLRDINIPAGWLKMNNNTIDTSSSAIADSMYIGVRLENFASHPTQVTIVNNKINNVRYGVHLTNAYKADASGNTITFPQSFTGHSSEEYFGILAENSTSLEISNNRITADSIPIVGFDTVLRAVSLDLTPYCTLRENYFEKMGAGIRVNMNSKPTFLYCNIFDTCRRVIYYENSGNLGHQGTSTRPWDNVFQGTIDTLKVQGDASGNIQSNWYFRGSETNTANIYNIEPSNPLLVAPFDSIDTKYTYCEDTVGHGGGGGGRDGAQSLADMTGEDEVGGGEFENEMRYMNDATIYRALDENDSLMNLGLPTDQVLQDFYDEYASSNIALFQEVKSLAETGEVLEATDLNDDINDTNFIEYNKRVVNEIYFAATENDTLSLDSTQKEVLESIAYQNPMEGGEAVFRARGMLGIYISSNSSSSYRNAKQEFANPKQFKKLFTIYPNPSKEYFVVKNNDKQEKKIQATIYDKTGRLKSKFDFTIIDVVNFSSEELPAGVYNLHLTSAEYTEAHKLIIMK